MRLYRGLWGQPLLALDAVLPVGIRLDQAGIDRKAFSANLLMTHHDSVPPHD